MKYFKWVMLILIATFFISQLTFGAIEILVQESGNVDIYNYGILYLTDIQGKIVISNPSKYDLYEVDIPYFLPNLNLVETSKGNNILINKIFVPKINALESYTIEYKIGGLTTHNIYDEENAILFNALTKDGVLFKSNLELNIAKTNITNNQGSSYREVSIHVFNPTPFIQEIKKIEIIKTDTMDPNAELAKWTVIANNNPYNMTSGEVIQYEMLDLNPVEGEIYWIKVDADTIDMSYQFSNTQNIIVIDKLEQLKENRNDGASTPLNTPDLEPIIQEISIFKSMPNQVVSLNKTFDVNIELFNQFYGDKLLTLTDTIPDHFEFVNSSRPFEYNEKTRTVVWKDFRINSLAKIDVNYKIKYIGENSYGLDKLPQAKVEYDLQTRYSNPVSYIKQFVVPKQLYVQKTVVPKDQGRFKITLNVFNLGQEKLTNLYVLEALKAEHSFEQVTLTPYKKGEWFIQKLNPGENWEVSYITNKKDADEMLPTIKGIIDTEVYYSLIMNQIISQRYNSGQEFSFDSIPTVALAIGLIILIIFKIYIIHIIHKKIKNKKNLKMPYNKDDE